MDAQDNQSQRQAEEANADQIQRQHEQEAARQIHARRNKENSIFPAEEQGED